MLFSVISSDIGFFCIFRAIFCFQKSVISSDFQQILARLKSEMCRFSDMLKSKKCRFSDMLKSKKCRLFRHFVGFSLSEKSTLFAFQHVGKSTHLRFRHVEISTFFWFSTRRNLVLLFYLGLQRHAFIIVRATKVS